MRVKTDAKRKALLQAATDVFLEQGYERTLMAQISARADCSKGTLYSYFASKEDIFCEAVLAATAAESNAVFVDLETPEEDVARMLRKFGNGFLQTLYTPRFRALRRLVFAASAELDVGRRVYDIAVRPYEERAAGLLQAAMDSGHLKQADSQVAASHLCALLESELLLRFLMNALDEIDPERLEAVASRAVAVFWAAYGEAPDTAV